MFEVQRNARGWPRLSAAIDSDPNFMIYRRFGYLRTRLLTYHQDVLREIEDALDELDHHQDNNHPEWRATGYREGDDARQPSERKELFQTLNKELCLYGQYTLEEPEMLNVHSRRS